MLLLVSVLTFTDDSEDRRSKAKRSLERAKSFGQALILGSDVLLQRYDEVDAVQRA